jgi:hypothetical protein
MLKRLAVLMSLIAILALGLGCRPAPPPGEQPDDIVYTPGGIAYRANVHEQGVTNPWPPIQTSTVVLADNVTITYRADIETKAGEARNNIITLRIPGRLVNDSRDLKLAAGSLPAGIQVKEGEQSGGLPGTIAQVLVVEISQGIKMGEYVFQIDVEFEGKDYGNIPCTIRVVQH